MVVEFTFKDGTENLKIENVLCMAVREYSEGRGERLIVQSAGDKEHFIRTDMIESVSLVFGGAR